MKVSFEGIGSMTATFEADGVAAGDMVKVTANGKVAKCADSDVPVGVAQSIWGDVATVQIGGYVRVPCDGGLTVGWQTVNVSGDKLKTAEEGGRGLMVVDVQNGIAGVIL